MKNGFLTLVRVDTWRVMRSMRSQLVIIVTACVLALLMQAVVAAGVDRLVSTMRTDSALSLIEVSSLPDSGRQELDEAALAEMAAVEHVEGVHPWYQIDVALADATDWPDPNENPGMLTLTTVVPGLTPKITDGAEDAFAKLTDGDVIIPDRLLGKPATALLGKEVRLEFTEIVSQTSGQPGYESVRVVAAIDNSVPDLAGPAPVFANAATVAVFQQRTAAPGTATTLPSTVYVQADDLANVAAVQTELANRGFSVRSVASQNPGLDGSLQLLSLGAPLFVGLAAIAAIGSGVSLAMVWTGQRRRDIGLLRSLGYEKRDIFWLVVLELGIVGLAIGMFSAVLGNVLAPLLTAGLATLNFDTLPVSPWSFPSIWLTVLLAVVPGIGMVLGAIRPASKAARLEPDVALRSD